MKNLLKLAPVLLCVVIISCQEPLINPESDNYDIEIDQIIADNEKPNTVFHLSFDSTFASTTAEWPVFSSDINLSQGINSQGLCFGRFDELQYASSNVLSTSEGTIGLWIKPYFEAGQGILHKILYFGRNPKNLEIHVDEHDLLAFGINSYEESKITVAYGEARYWVPGEWHHIAFSWDSLSIAIYIDGHLENLVETQSKPELVSDSIFHIGSLYGEEGFDGMIDELTIWQEKLNGKEIQSLYQIHAKKIGTSNGTQSCEEETAFEFVTTANNSDYFISNKRMTWAEAKIACENAKGHLVVIESEEENQTVMEVLAYVNENAWIGLTDEVEEGSFVWVDQSENSYTNWNEGEPNNTAYPGCHESDYSSCDEEYVHMHGSYHPNPGTWNDAPNDVKYYAVMEIEQ